MLDYRPRQMRRRLTHPSVTQKIKVRERYCDPKASVNAQQMFLGLIDFQKSGQ